MKTMRRKGKATDLRNQTFRSNSRKIAYKFFLKDIAPRIPNIDAAAVKFEPITPAAINQYFLWEGPTLFPWDDLADWKSKDAKGLDLAIWYKQILCGLVPSPDECAVAVLEREDLSVPLRGQSSFMIAEQNSHPCRNKVLPLGPLTP